VMAVSTASFGTTIKGGHTPPLAVANSVLSKPPADIDPPQLPNYSALRGKIGSDIIREKPKADLLAAQTKVGAALRQTGQSLDTELRATRVFGGRQPVPGEPGGVKTNGSGDTRPTGAVVRPPVVNQQSDPPVKQPPVYSPPVRNETQPTTVKPPRSEPAVKPPTQQYDPPVRHDPPVKQPSYTPPTRQDPPVKSPPRSDPPKSEAKPAPSPSRSDSGASTKAETDR